MFCDILLVIKYTGKNIKKTSCTGLVKRGVSVRNEWVIGTLYPSQSDIPTHLKVPLEKKKLFVLL